jgi:hypothetical protein
LACSEESSESLTAVARKAGVRISTINSDYGLPEIAVRTGGNAKIRLRITVPASMPNRGVWTTFDVAVQ